MTAYARSQIAVRTGVEIAMKGVTNEKKKNERKWTPWDQRRETVARI